MTEREKMARTLCGKEIDCSTCVGMRSDIYHTSKQDCEYFKYSKKAIDANYRKIPEGSVVLTRDEYERLKKEELYAQGKYNLCNGNRSIEAIAKTTEQTGQMLIDYDRRIRKAYDEIIPKLLEENNQARKKTAKEIFKRLCNVEYSIYDDAYGYANALVSEFEKIFNEYGVEEEE